MIELEKSPSYIALRDYYLNPPVMRLVKCSRNENSISDILAWLFDPEARHTLGCKPLGLLLKLTENHPPKANQPSIQLSKETLPTLRIRVRREDSIPDGAVDIVIRMTSEATYLNRTLVLENKIGAAEGTIEKGETPQTIRYYNHYNDPSEEQSFIFLTQCGARPPCSEHFSHINYQKLVREILEPLLSTLELNTELFDARPSRIYDWFRF